MKGKLQALHLVLFVMLIFISLRCHESDEKEITETQVPVAILEAFNNAYPNVTVREYIEEEQGQKIYKISFRKENNKIDASYARDGKLIEVEETVAASDVPSAIRDELDNKFQEYKIKEIEKITNSSGTVYEVELSLESNGKNSKHELLFSKDGRLLEKEVDHEEDDEE